MSAIAGPAMNPMNDFTNSEDDDFSRALDDAAGIEAGNRLMMNRALAFAGGAAAGLIVTLIVLKARG